MKVQSGLLSMAAILLLTTCTGGRTERAYIPHTGGTAAAGKALIAQHDCGSCHLIPGVRGANGLVAPPLLSFARRTFIAGEVPNSPANLVKWIMSPPSIEPGTAMPVLGLSEDEARNVAAYLYTLQ